MYDLPGLGLKSVTAVKISSFIVTALESLSSSSEKNAKRQIELFVYPFTKNIKKIGEILPDKKVARLADRLRSRLF